MAPYVKEFWTLGNVTSLPNYQQEHNEETIIRELLLVEVVKLPNGTSSGALAISYVH